MAVKRLKPERDKHQLDMTFMSYMLQRDEEQALSSVLDKLAQVHPALELQAIIHDGFMVRKPDDMDEETEAKTVAEVLKGRGVSLAEAKELNPGVDLGKAVAGQLLKLPYGRYTQREKEMLSSVVPASSLGLGAVAPSSQQLQLGLLLALGAAAYAAYVKLANDFSARE